MPGILDDVKGVWYYTKHQLGVLKSVLNARNQLTEGEKKVLKDGEPYMYPKMINYLQAGYSVIAITCLMMMALFIYTKRWYLLFLTLILLLWCMLNYTYNEYKYAYLPLKNAKTL